MSDLQIIGPKRAGILDQFLTLGWKFYSKRFGPYGNAFQYYDGNTGIERIVLADGRKHHRRLEGKNGWLWRYVFRKIAEIRRIERERELHYMRVPDEPRWYQRAILKWMFGYKYPWRER